MSISSTNRVKYAVYMYCQKKENVTILNSVGIRAEGCAVTARARVIIPLGSEAESSLSTWVIAGTAVCSLCVQLFSIGT